jgi:hypothetical protein
MVSDLDMEAVAPLFSSFELNCNEVNGCTGDGLMLESRSRFLTDGLGDTGRNAPTGWAAARMVAKATDLFIVKLAIVVAAALERVEQG